MCVDRIGYRSEQNGLSVGYPRSVKECPQSDRPDRKLSIKLLASRAGPFRMNMVSGVISK